MQTKHFRFILPLLLAFACSGLFLQLTPRCSAGVAYAEPTGGWQYVFTGDQAAGAPRRQNQPALDGTWRHENGSDEWNGDVRGAANAPGGGLEVNSAGDVTYLTIEDAVNITSGQNNNRKLYFVHDLVQDGVTDLNLLDTGVTISFRARLTPPDGKEEITLPNGYGIFSAGKGNFGIRQSSPSSVVSFSLVQSSEDGDTSNNLLFPTAGLTMNGLTGDAPDSNGSINAGVNSRTSAAMNPNTVAVDPTEWHEFWVTIQANDATPGNGTHTVSVYVDGSVVPETFNVTAGTGSDTDTTITPNWTDYIGMGCNNSPTLGAFDTDFFAYKAGVHAPEAATLARVAWVSFHPADGTPSANAATAGFTQAPDVGYTRLLEENGFEVTRIVTSVTPDAGLLNTFDLVIVGRSVNSGHYQNAGATAWNGITAPMMVMGGYTLRNSRMGYTTGGTIPDTTNTIQLTVNNPAHPIFAGIALDAGGTMVNPFAGIETFNGTTERGISVNTDPVAGGGTVLATVGTTEDPTFGGMIIGEWAAGSVMGNAAANVLGGPRLVFLSGSREHSGLTSEGAGIYDLEPDGEQLFLRAVQYMTGTLPGALVASVVQTGGDTDRPEAKLTGQTVDVLGGPAGYTVPYFAEEVLAFTDRTHQYNGVLPAVPLPGYLLGGEYVMIANNNRDNPDFQLEITLNRPALIYLLIDNRVGNGTSKDNAPNFATEMSWVPAMGFVPRVTGASRLGTLDRPDEFGVDNNGDGMGPGDSIEDYGSIYMKQFKAGTVTLPAQNRGGINMYGVVITPVPDENIIGTQPESLLVAENTAASFSVEVIGGPEPYGFQWYFEGAAIAGANAATHTIPLAQFADQGSYFVVVTNQGGNAVTSSLATLTVQSDIDPPTVVSATGDGTLRQVVLVFSETIDPNDAADLFNYYIDPIGVNSAVLVGDRTVVLGTGPQTPNTVYTVEVFNLRDLANNMVDFPTTVDFTSWVLSPGFMVREFYYDLSGPNNFGTLTNSPKYPAAPDLVDYFPQYAVNPALGDTGRDSYGVKVSGFIIPSESGEYQFQLHSDDSGWLLLSPTDEPALKDTVILAEGDCGGCSQPASAFSYNLTAGQAYYTEALMQEGTGGDYLVIRWSTPSNPGVFVPIPGGNLAVAADPNNMATITIVEQPQSQTIDEFFTATFTVGAVNDLGVAQAYQWRKNGTPIPAANGSSYTTPPMPVAESGAVYDVVVSVPGGSVTSDPAVLTVTPDTTPPQVVSIASVGGLQIGVEFNELMFADSATDPFNWAVSDSCGPKVITGITSRSGTEVVITLDSSTPVVEDFTVVVSGVSDAALNPMLETTVVGELWAEYEAGIGGSSPLGETFTSRAGKVQVQADGTDIWGTADQFNFVYALETADFDKMTKVSRLDQANAWTKAGIMARKTLDAGSENTMVLTTPPTGQNVLNWQTRSTAGAASASMAAAQRPQVIQLPMWLRLKRTGTVYEYLYSRDGTTWLAVGTTPSFDRPWLGGPVLVGPATTSHSAGALTTADYEYMDTETYPAAELTCTGLTDLTVQENAQPTLIVATTLAGAPEGMLQYRWYIAPPGSECFTLVDGQYGASATLPMLALGDSGTRVKAIASVPGKRAVCGPVTINVVNDEVPPLALGARATLGLMQVVVTFDELVEATSATDFFNYTLTGNSVVGGNLNPDGTSVTLDLLDPLGLGQSYCLEIVGVTDLAGNVIETTNICFQSFVITCGGALMEVYLNVPGGDIPSLTSSPNFPGSPDAVETVTSLELPRSFGDNYGVRFTGWLLPPVSGAYHFAVSSDDNSEFWLSTDADPGNKVLLAREPQWNNSRDWTGAARRTAGAPENQSATLFPAGIDLVAGNRYYFELLMNEGTGGDNVAVTWQIPGTPPIANGVSLPISGGYLATYADPVGAAITITQQPQDTSVLAFTPASFTVAADAVHAGQPTPVNYQWQMDDGSGTFVNVPGADRATYEFIAAQCQGSAVYRAEMCALGSDPVYSEPATLTIQPDTVAPQVVSVERDFADHTQVVIEFDRIVDPASASDPFNYLFNNGVAVSSVALNPEGTGVTLTVNPALENYPCENYILQVVGVGNACLGAVTDAAVEVYLEAPLSLDAPAIVNVVETGGRNEATDTITAQWTGQTFVNGVGNEPLNSSPADAPYTVGYFGDLAPAFVDRRHAFFAAALPGVPMPPYLVNQEYIMSGNDNRDMPDYRLDVTVSKPVTAYMLIDNRLADGNVEDPPTFDATHMQWMLDEGWAPVLTGNNRSGNAALPDEVGIDENADGSINGWYSVYAKAFPAGTFQLKQADNANRNMYGVVIGRQIGTRLIQNVVEVNGDNEAVDTVAAKWTGRTLINGVANEPLKNTPAEAGFTVGYFGYMAPAYVDRAHAYYAADEALPIPGYLLNQEYIMLGNDNKDNTDYRLDITVNAPARVYFLYDQRNTLPGWVTSEGFQPVRTGANRTGDTSIPDEVGIDENADGSINQRFNIYSKVYPVGTFSIYEQAAGGNMYGLVIGRGPTIGNVVETGGDNDPTDTIAAKWTGQTFVNGIANEPLPGTPANAAYTVGYFENLAPAFVDRNHKYFVNLPNVPIPSYLVGQEYIMSGNDNRDNAGYRLDVTVNSPVTVYMLIDNRLPDGVNTTPPSFGASAMQWILDENWQSVITGNNREASMSVPDEIAFDEGADGTIEQYYSVYSKVFPAGTFALRQADNAGRNMYGVVVAGIALGNAVQNNPPTFDLAAATIESRRNSGPQTETVAVNIQPGPPSEADQTVTKFEIVNNDNPGLFTSLAIAPDGTLTYEATADACGTANITIVAQDDGGPALNPACSGDTSAPATFTVVIFDDNACPVALGQEVATDEDTAVALLLEAHDADLGGGCGVADFTFEVVTQPMHGTLSGAAPDLVYTPAPDFCGTDSFAFVVSDGECTSAEPGVVTIMVLPVPDCPVASDSEAIVEQGSSVPILLQGIDPDAICEPSTVRFWVIPPAHGYLRGVPPNVTYTPAPDFCGADSFLFLIDDGVCFARGMVSIEVIGVNRCPLASAQSVSTCENSPVAITLTGTDPDEAGCGATIQSYAIAQPPAHGTLSGAAPDVVYTPGPDFDGWDAFTFTVSDGECVSEPATVSVQVNPGNGAPTCQIVVGPLLKLTPDVTENIVLACDNLMAEVVFDATLCADPEGGAVTYMWLVDGNPLGSAAIETVVLELGTHEITLVVEDIGGGTGECASGPASSTRTAWVTVVDGCEAVEGLVTLVEQSDIHPSLRATLRKEAKDACKKFAKGKCEDGVKELEKFQDKVMHYDMFYKKPSKKASAKKQIDHETAVLLIDAAQAIIDAYDPCDCMEKK